MKRYKLHPVVANEIWIGIDLHRVQWVVTIRVRDIELFHGSIPGTWTSLRVLLERFPAKQVHVVYEAGYFGFWLFDCLAQWGAHCIVTPPSLLPQEAGNRVKTDRRDSRKLALLLMKGMLKAVWVLTPEQRSHRDVLRRRHGLMQDRTRVQSRIKALLQFYGIQLEAPQGAWTKRYYRSLRALTWNDKWQHENFQRLLDEYWFLSEQIKLQTDLVHRLAGESYAADVKLLRSLDGVGMLTAMELLLELPNIARFHRAEQLAAYVGLTPSQYSSGEHIRMGRITKAGKSHLRATLVELAWRVIAKNPAFRAVYHRIKARAGSKRAIVAVARRLLLCIRRMILDGQPYLVPQTVQTSTA